MTTLAINAPDKRVKDGADSFETILASGIGKGYAIYPKIKSRLTMGSKVVLIRKDRNKKRAEGILLDLVETNEYVNGIRRYDVHIQNMTKVKFEKVNFNYYGVAII